MSPVAVKPLIDASVLAQIGVRVGTIESVSEIEGSDRLVRLDVR